MYKQLSRNKRRSVIAVLCFLIVWVGIGAIVGLIFAWPKQTLGYDQFGNLITTTSFNPASIFIGMGIAGALALAACAWCMSSGEHTVLAASGAKPADPLKYQQLHNIVEALAIGDGLPKPTVYVIDDPSPNAFATGMNPNRAAITATTGLLQIMNREELEGVIGHEMSHIKNYDVRVILLVSTLLGLATLLASIMWRGIFFSGRGRNSGQLVLFFVVLGALLTIVGLVIGPLMKLMLSRSRESLADVSGVELTRNPAGLISALKKLQSNDKPFSKFNHATAAMCIDDPLQHHTSWIHQLYATHPPIAQRIAVLEQIASGQTV
jgi:heat shock protein HtpX